MPSAAGRTRSALAAVLAVLAVAVALPPAWAAWTATTGNPASTAAAAVDFDAGRLHGWGDNTTANLGLGHTTSPQTSVVTIGSATDWFDVATGNNRFDATRNANSGHACGLRGTGTLWCWGKNEQGQLGTGGTTDQTTPVRVGSAADWTEVDSGDSSVCGIRTGGTLWCWGYNNFGGLGLGDTTNRYAPTQVPTVPSGAAAGTTWASVGMSSVGACAVRSDRALWCWGYNGDGQVGNGSSSAFSNVESPVRIGTATTWKQVVGGWYHHCATRTDGTLWCWGRGDDGRLGVGDTTERTVPTQVATVPPGAAAGTTWSEVAAGSAHTCAVRSDRSLWCWGDGAGHQLGLGTAVSRSSPGRVGTATTWTSVAPGYAHTCGTQLDRTVWCWGEGGEGALGSGGTADATVPAEVPGITGPVTTGSGAAAVFVVE